MRRTLCALVAVCALVTASQCGGNAPTTPTPPPVPDGPTPPGPPPPPVVTPPTSPGGAVFAGAGDIGQCGSPGVEATARLLDAIPGDVFTLGDNAYPSGTLRDFRECYEPSWGRHKRRTHPSPGNHDWQTDRGGPYFEYFGANAGPPGRGYYSFTLGDWLILSLNSNISVGAQSTQGVWLRQELAATPRTCTLAYWHHPYISSGQNGSTASMRDIWTILYDAGADVVLAGHDHLYERFAPQTADGRADQARGIRSFIAGTGGASLYRFEGVKPNSEARYSAFGVLKLTLRATDYDWEFIATDGYRDIGTGTCH